MQGRRAGEGWRRDFAQATVFVLAIAALTFAVPSLRSHAELLAYMAALVFGQTLDRTLSLGWWPAPSNRVWRAVHPVFIAVILLLVVLLTSALISGLRS